MRFGAIYNIQKDSKNNILKASIQKVFDGDIKVDETVYEQRVQIMKIQDFEQLMEQLHIDHALRDHGGWIEYRGNKMYAVLSWTEPTS